MTHKEILLLGIGQAALDATLAFIWFKLGVGDAVISKLFSIIF